MGIQQEIYNNTYRSFTPDFIHVENLKKIDEYLELNSESLKDFINKYLLQFENQIYPKQLSVLELGSGLGCLSYFLESKFNSYTGIDISELAIMNAKQISRIKERNLNFLIGDVTKPDFKLDGNFDFLIDSHLFHCLTDPKDIISYLTFVKKHLSVDGQFLIETMAFHPKLQTPVGYSFDENYILYKEINGKDVPIRSIKKSMDIEETLKQVGFKIKYLYYHNELSFDVFDEYENYPEEFLPKTIRIAATL